jgi:sugar O-acyltransferase (sialic acid O-acetyltransferase NeuD family)
MQIIGKGGFAREVESYIRSSTADRECRLFEGECEGISKHIPTIIAIGDGSVRAAIWEKFKYLPFTNYNDGHIFGDVDMGIGNIICPGTILTTGIKLGHHNLINLNCTIGHDCAVGDFVTMSPGANVSGNVTIGNGCYIGTNAVIREKISICDNVVIGAGGVVVKDITEPGVYVGNPVKKIG